MRPLRPVIILWLSAASIAPAGLYLLCGAEEQALRLIEQGLTRATGVSSSVARLGPSPSLTGLALHRVRVGQVLEIDRVELLASPAQGAARVILHRPLLRPRLMPLDDPSCDGLLSRLGRKQARAAPRPRGPGARSLPSVGIRGGALTIGCVASDGSPLSLTAEGIHLDASGSAPPRLVAGPIRLSRNGQALAEISAVGLDLDPERGWRPIRGASVGGQLSHNGQALLSLQVGRLRLGGRGGEKTDSRAVTVELTARPVGRARARGRVTLSLTHAPDTPTPHRLRVTLSDVDASGLGPLAGLVGLAPDEARLGGVLTADGSWQRYSLRASLVVKRLSLTLPAIAPRSVGPIDGRLELRAEASPATREARIEQLALSTGATTVELSGELGPARRDGQPTAEGSHLKLRVKVPTMPCQKVLSSLPAGFAPHLEGLALRGEIGLAAELDLDSSRIERTKLDLALTPMTCKVTADPPAGDVRQLDRGMAVSLLGAGERRERWQLSPANPLYRRLGKISPHVRAAFVAAEDANFFRHDGFDTRQLHRAFVDNLRAGRMLRGASTISQQLVKNAFLDHRRNLSRKFQETVLTWRMEQVLSKKRILELYLNVVEMGPGVHGVEQACRRYFGHGADRATPLQAAHLAAMTPSPRPLAERFARADPGPAWMEKLRQVLRLMRRNGAITLSTQKRWSNRRLRLVRPDPASLARAER